MTTAAVAHTMFSTDKTEADRQWAVLTIVLATYLLILLDTSIVITGLPDIAKDFGFSPSSLSWVQNAYTLFFGGFLMVGARAGDLFGRKRVYLTGVAIFTLASLAIGLAQSGTMLVVARAIQGVGAAILAPATMALLTIHFPEGEPRTKALSAYAATAGIGASLGLVLGGFFAGALSWRVGFLVNVPVGIILWWAGRSLLVETPRTKGAPDMLSAGLSTLGMGSLVYGIVSSATGWAQIEAWGACVLGIALLAAFFLRQAGAKAPLLPLSLFASSSRTASYVARMMFIGAMVGFFFYATQLMQVVMGMTPFQAGLGFLPMTAMTFVASLLIPRGTRLIGTGGVLALAFLCAALGLFWLGQQPAHSTYLWNVGLPMLLLGIGNGAALGPLTVAGMSGVAKADAGAASGVVNTAHQLGGTLGLASLVALAATFSDSLADHIVLGFNAAAILQLAGLALTLLFVARPR
ncbi:MFS transporter [Aestuariivirga litoralis]|uniref:MFS transporter n=1 Tax=Aestuariivirga litoralis TaxID=2650924 RepID=UPI0018C4A59D|nr:MFS transporter [Aestuariivirga litoralis]MBG1232247.1 MFS transporter [Aestuariivirga litoralis]